MDKIPHVLAITGGKGGVGKSNVTVNLAVELSKTSKVLVVDADTGLANVHILLGMNPGFDISDLYAGRAELDEIIYHHDLGFDLLPAASGDLVLASLSVQEIEGLLSILATLKEYDYILLDTPAGLGHASLSLTSAADQVILVVVDEPTSLADAYALIKVMNLIYKKNNLQILVNMASSIEEGHKVFAKLTKVADRFLNVSLRYIGAIPFDKCVSKAVKRRKPFVTLYPQARASLAVSDFTGTLKNTCQRDTTVESRIFNHYTTY